MSPFRIASWNLQGRSAGAARLGSVLAELGGADLVLLQEASQHGLSRFVDAAGLDWGVHVREQFFDLLKVRGRAGGRTYGGEPLGNCRYVAIAGRGEPPRGVAAFPDMPLPEKVMAGWVDIAGERTTVVTYHAPTGVQHGIGKPEQAVRLARWLADIDGPMILGGDFNSPGIDHPDFAQVRTGWHTGDAHLEGAPGEDLFPLHGSR